VLHRGISVKGLGLGWGGEGRLPSCSLDWPSGFALCPAENNRSEFWRAFYVEGFQRGYWPQTPFFIYPHELFRLNTDHQQVLHRHNERSWSSF
jgi:hypothetical protein